MNMTTGAWQLMPPPPHPSSARASTRDDAEAMKQGIIDDLMKHIETQKIHDDITLIVIRHR